MPTVIYHNHHVIPKHAGGNNDPSNLIRLSIEDHAEAHHTLYEQYGRIEDLFAWKGLSGQTEEAEMARRQLVSQRLRGVPKTEQHKEKIRNALLANPSLGMLGKKQSPEWCQWQKLMMQEWWRHNPNHKFNAGKRIFMNPLTSERKMFDPSHAPAGWIRAPRSKL